MADDRTEGAPEGPVSLPITGELDLHTFRPQDVKGVVLDYLEECRKRGLCVVRIVHGKGVGNLRRTVHALLARHPDVRAYALASAPFGGWGATIVHLRPPEAGPGRAGRAADPVS
ncbi:MAG TPA: Smr/MutS family protein [Verrucomicrobiota bacterium]|nr:Smr/MutS family protein [Verrucomicrobiota bacterium]HNU52133.1 Smr/MutS family protein [Verrucomicrobiota bacterium]